MISPRHNSTSEQNHGIPFPPPARQPFSKRGAQNDGVLEKDEPKLRYFINMRSKKLHLDLARTQAWRLACISLGSEEERSPRIKIDKATFARCKRSVSSMHKTKDVINVDEKKLKK